jgi:hypothetical protein
MAINTIKSNFLLTFDTVALPQQKALGERGFFFVYGSYVIEICVDSSAHK